MLGFNHRPRWFTGDGGRLSSQSYHPRHCGKNHRNHCPRESCHMTVNLEPYDILEFWSSIGEEQFPRLAKLARFLLGISVAPLPLINKKGGINSGLNSEEIGILLNLRPNILNSVNHQLLSRYKQQQQQ
ncbi:unnamed protein product [Meloidogyne enterolobii]|uniref:Uncharacterized protein n=1 Tax=Meloidogyne enterolobii TaxID=390850 RepID=A0ACB0YDB5_MELEN